MFGQIAPQYDFLNHFLSFSLDRVWRRRTAERFRHVLMRPEARVLDLCCGTGDLAIAHDRGRATMARNSGVSGFPVIGVDFARPMLERAKGKAREGGHAAEFIAGDALELPFGDATFDLVMTAFGFRNLANYGQGLGEIARVLKQGGEVGILEFSEPESGAMAGLFRFYFRRIVPLIGGAISGSGEAYSYLPGSVAKFPSPTELAAMMREAGFAEVRLTVWNFGSVVLHMGRRVK
jgi:demethylmenaquinone methyltransferase/2-methoxy-6-polyprenyl-1,4-benzoquinol methylase